MKILYNDDKVDDTYEKNKIYVIWSFVLIKSSNVLVLSNIISLL